ncbi:hypothetical protein PAXRUDRAFT_36279 [Paxillus rubicundulus Ve08.2h10]|uniref:Unplaced genomic scaffold scaffold_1268, whole genome shotgun sequence n=1 Tax=Paxillus rubicundulus Ve08.2h10 TaxID=930991 RepID=A0A0D0DG33_9AGAM|nr:hypothetical protein PAXRUDRAFT_36279 [Paxillus rubicundulus Ve08.2h10]
MWTGVSQCIVLRFRLQAVAKKAADDKCLRDAEAARAQAIKDGIQCLAMMEIEADEKEAEIKANKPKHVCPQPHVSDGGGKAGKGTGSKTLTKPQKKGGPLMASQREADDDSEMIKDWKTQNVNSKLTQSDAITTGTTSKKFALGGPIKNWAPNVAEASKPRAAVSLSSKHSATSSTPASLPPLTTFTSASSKVATGTSLSNHSCRAPPVPTNTPEPIADIFADMVVDAEEELATLKGVKAGSAKDVLELIQPAESDEDIDRPFTQHDTSHITSGSDLDRAAKMIKYTPIKGTFLKGHHHTTSSTSIGVTIKTSLPPQKRIKLKEPVLTHPTSSSIKDSQAINVLTSGSQAQDSIQYDVDGYIFEAIKKCSNYSNKDLPMPSDQRWSQGVITTVMLWCGAQPKVWSIPEDELVAALQFIVDVVYPGLKYQVTPAGSVFGVAIQRVSEWQSGFGSMALAMMIDFYLQFDDNTDIPTMAAALHENYGFIQEDPDEHSPNHLYHSKFLLELIASTHLSNISGFVDIPGWNTRKLTSGQDQVGVIAIALEHTVQFIMNSVIDIEQILLEMVETGDLKPKIKLPKVLNKVTGHESSTPYQFSASNWGSTFASAQLLKNMKNSASDVSGSVNDMPESGINPQSLLCIFLFSFQPFIY